MFETEISVSKRADGKTALFRMDVSMEIAQVAISEFLKRDLLHTLTEKITEEIAPKMLEELLADEKLSAKILSSVRLLLAEKLISQKKDAVQK